MATHVDTTNAKIDRMSTRVTSFALAIGGSLVGAALLAALRLT